MASSKQFYRDRLGISPQENGTDPNQQHHYHQQMMRDGNTTGADFKTFSGYEESLCKFKGIVYSLNIYQLIDERDAIQKKTFTKWVNKHLKKHWGQAERYTFLAPHFNYSTGHVDEAGASYTSNGGGSLRNGSHGGGTSTPPPQVLAPIAGRKVHDLFTDLRDGHALVSLLEVLSGEHLPRDRGNMRFHMLHNVQVALDFLRYRKIKLVNIRSEDIVDGNTKLTLGLIWTIILHFQISDIMVGQTENLTAKEALLRWAKRTTHKYPGVNVTNFTTSWKDGLAMIAIIHRNRPDMVDWRALRNRNPRERLELAFNVMEKEYGVTRLLDPEDVDTPDPDEKSLITYVSQLYEIFPEPPSIHPLYSIEAQRKLDDYRDLASNLLRWIHEHFSVMKDRRFPTNSVELKRLAQESTRFRQDEIPPRQRDKTKCQQMYREIQRLLDGTGFLEDELPGELHYSNIEIEWNKLMGLFQERDDLLHESMNGADRLQRLAEKINRDIRQTEGTLDEVKIRIEEEARRIDRLHPSDAKRNCDEIEEELQQCEDTIRSLHQDVRVLKDNKYHEAPTLHKKVVKLEERYVNVRTLFENRLLIVLNNKSVQETYTTQKRVVVTESSRLTDNNEHFKFLQECITWCKDKLKKLNDSEYGNDLSAVEKEYETHQREHKIIHQFHANVDQCANSEKKVSSEEHPAYMNLLAQLRKTYADLLSKCNKRVSDLFALLEFLQAATQELMWLNEREETEVNRDWTNKNLNIAEVERYCDKLMSELEKRENQFSSVQDKGNQLVMSHHPASNTVEAYLAAMQTQWQWLLELTLCLETHLQHAAHYHNFFTEVSKAEHWTLAQDEKLNTSYSVTDFGLDDGEQLLREMQDIREELSRFQATVEELIDRSKTIVPLKQRRQSLRQPTSASAVCNYKKTDITITKGERCTVHDNSNRVKWRVVNSLGTEGMVPGVVFTIPPPNQEAIDAAEKLKRNYERVIALWQKKQLRMRQNMIFATIKVVKSWDLNQFIAMGADQRNAIRRALNEDAEKLIQEGDPNEPQLRRLKREIEEVNRLFDEFERRANEPKPGQVLVDQCSSLKDYLDMMEKTLIQRCLAGIPRDLDLLEQLVIEHKQFENDLSTHELEVEGIQKNYQSLSRRTPAIQRTVDSITQQWDRIWALSHVYIERMKCVEMVVTGIEEGTQVVSEVEQKLAEHSHLPDDLDDLNNVHHDLLQIQQVIQDHQVLIDKLLEECRNVRTLVVRSRPTQKIHPDVDKLEEDVRKLRMRWENICTQIIERLRSCEAATKLLEKYRIEAQEEKIEMQRYENELRNQKIEDLGPSEAELEAERLREMYIEIIQRQPKIENVNILGARFIREAKIYDLQLSQYRQSLEEVHPSLNASVQKSKDRKDPGEVKVSKELDELNAQYQFVADEIYDRIAKILNRYSKERNFSFSLDDLAPVNLETTYKTQLNLSPQDMEILQMPIHVNGTHKSEVQMDISKKTQDEVMAREEETVVYSSQQTTTTRRIICEGGLKHPVTGESLTLAQAVAGGMLMLAKGLFVRPDTGEQMTLKEAVHNNYISKTLYSELNKPCGIVDPNTGKKLTILEATKLGIFDPNEGYFKDPKTGKHISQEEAANIGFVLMKKVSNLSTLVNSLKPSVSLYQAVNSGEIDVETGKYTNGRTGEILTIVDAFIKGYLILDDVYIQGQSLTDVIIEKKIDSDGKIRDKNRSTVYTLTEAIQNGIISDKFLEIVDPSTGKKITLRRAIDKGIIVTDGAYYKNVKTGENLPYSEAVTRNCILKPFGLGDAYIKDILTDENRLIDAFSGDKTSVLDSVGRGYLDTNIKHIKNCETSEFLSIPEAFSEGILIPSGSYVEKVTGFKYTLREAVQRGYIVSVTLMTITDIKCIKISQDLPEISLQEALDSNIIEESGFINNPNTNVEISLKESADKGIIPSQIATTLQMPLGIKDENGKELTVLQALSRKIADINTGGIVDSKGKEMTLEEAIIHEKISIEGAGILEGIRNISLIHTISVKSLDSPCDKLITKSNSTVGFQDSIIRSISSGVGSPTYTDF